MAEWKEAARKEVNRTREIISTGLDFRSRKGAHDFSPFQTGPTQRSNPSRSNNGGIMPMDINTAATAPQAQLPFKNLQTKNAFSSARRGGASGAASRATWPENVQDEHHARIRLRLFAQTKPRPPKVRNRWTKNLQPQFEPQQWDPNSRKHSKLQQSKNQWMMKKGGCTWMPEIWARIFTMSSPNGRGLDN